ncbi:MULTISPECIES: response regulator transcription factor [Brevibacterium]|uniref:Response regulator transcription factor n=1 Tax=Brevibacterium ammoniilyticum TaxID=1046555 RepID=A0ABP9U3S9_9MICO|nr:response regulator transcription factor [Brevibacterium sp. W7.2]
MSITVLVADDQALVRDGIVTVLSLAEGIEVIGEASDGIEAVALAEELTPDVVLMDLRMPNLGGAEATARLAQSCPGVRVLVLTTFGDDASIDSALRAGAAGFLTKDAGREEMIAAIRATAAGGTPLDARIAGRVVAGLPEAHPVSLHERFPELTVREADVLRLMAEGATNPEIAEHLFLGVSTVKSHINSLFAKLGVSRRSDAIALARGEGGLPPARMGDDHERPDTRRDRP